MSPWPRKYSFSLGIWAALALALTAGTARARTQAPSTPSHDAAAQVVLASTSGTATRAAGYETTEGPTLTERDAHPASDRDGDEEEEPKDSLADGSAGLELPAPLHSEGRTFVPVAAPVLQARVSARLPRGPPAARA